MSSPITKKDIPSPELMSPLCCSVSESQQHLLVCDKLEDTSIVSRIPEYEDLFTNDVSKVVGVTSIIKSKQNGFHTVFLGDLGAGIMCPPRRTQAASRSQKFAPLELRK